MSRKLAALLTFVALLAPASLPAAASGGIDPFTSRVSGVVAFDPHVYGRPAGRPVPGAPDLANTNTTNDGNAQNETTIDVHPSDSHIVVGGVNDYRVAANGDVNCGYGRSDDGGLTWSADFLRGMTQGNGGPFNYDAAGDPALYYAADGTVHFICLAFDRDFGRSALLHTDSSDGGVTWSTPTAIVQSNSGAIFHDKEYLTIDNSAASPFLDRIYVQWTQYSDGFFVSRQYIAYSSDDGATWSLPILISPGQSETQGAHPAVGPDGTVYAAWCSPCFGADSLWVNKSTNGGDTWEGAVMAASLTAIPSPLPGNSFRTNSFPTTAVDQSNGNVYVAYSDYTSGNADIMFVRSLDDGATWSTPIRVNGRPADDQFFQWMDVSVGGIIWVCYYDQSWNAMNWLDASCSKSRDHGLSFNRTLRVSSVSSDPSDDGFGGAFIGDYNGLGLGSGNFPRFLWTDTRTGNAEAFIFGR